MAEPEDEEAPLSEAQVLEVLQPTAARLAAILGLPDAAGEVLLTIRADDAAVELLRAAFESGRAESAAAIALRGDGSPAPDYSDVESLGERRMIAREDSACSSCVNASICVVARAAPPELLVVISRCLAHRTS